MNAPQNWPRQGYPQQQPPYGPPPPRKKRTGLVVGILITVVVLVVGGVAAVLYLDYTAPAGTSGAGEQPLPQCDIGAETRKSAKVGKFRLAGKPTDSGLKISNCFWEQGDEDGKDKRVLQIQVYDHSAQTKDEARSRKLAEDDYANLASAPYGGDQAKPLDGLGDQATYVAPGTKTYATEVDLVVRKGLVIYRVAYSGEDKGFFGSSAFPVEDAEAVVREVAEDLVAK
ncbi:hypothetical protein [Actinosynnema sp. NPDC020468]|uniref:hypothetical protein n=1 Tax=Actinosynnema sp. NPDC020468 TaxID=3154488 RepID=UPI0033C79C80